MNKKPLNKNLQILSNDSKIFIKRKLYIVFSIISGLIIAWSITHNFTNFAKDPNPAIANETNLKLYFGHFSWFFYFTTISNMLFFIVTTIRIFYRKRIFNDQMQIIVATYMLIVGIIYWAVIAPSVWGAAIKNGKTSMFAPNWFFINYIFGDFTLHLTTVILALILGIVGVKKVKYNFKNQISKLITFPLIYYVFAWLLYYITIKFGSHGGAYIYNFLNFFNPFGMHNLNKIYLILVNIAIFIIVLSLFIVIHYFMIKINTFSYNRYLKKEEIKTNNVKKVIPIKTVENKQKVLKLNNKVIKKTTVKSKRNIGVKYIIQKSKNTNGWELKKVGGKRATYIASTKQEVQKYYDNILQSKIGTTVIEKGRHGKIKNVKKFTK